MFDKKFYIVLVLGILIILGILFGKKAIGLFSSVDKIPAFEPKSLEYYKKSCRYENSQMCNELGDMYHKGDELVSIDFDEAVNYYTRSCELENGQGCNNLAYMLNEGKGVGKNNWHALKLYKKACKYDTMEACYNVGSMYYHGEGTKRNYYNAVHYFQKACNHGIGAGCNDLGYMYEHGRYLGADIHQAMSHYADACEMLEPLGCNNLAYLKEKRGNMVSAKQLYKKACILGHKYSCNRLENVLGNRITAIKDEIALKEAITACNDSTYGGTMCYKVGLYYEKEEEEELAREYFEKACARQQSQSCKHLGDLYRR
jgi:TPR repeat protein